MQPPKGVSTTDSAEGSALQSIQEAAEDKKYFLEKLKQQNEVAEALSDYLQELVEASASLGTGEADVQKGRVDASLRRVEVALARIEVPDAKRAEVDSLRAALERDRKLFALIRQQLARPVPSSVRPVERRPLPPP